MTPTALPSDPIARYQFALSLHNSGRLDEAAELYQSMLQQFPGNPLLMTGLGIIALQHGNLSEGVKQLEQSLQIEPQQPMAHSNLGLALWNLKQPDKALASLDRAIALAPDFADAYNHRGNVLRDMKRLDEALASYDRAIALNPNFAETYNNRGVTLHDLNRLDEALASFDRALALKPNAADSHSGRGRVLQDLRRMDEALAAQDKAIALKPDLALAWWNKALLLLLTGDYAEGWRLYEWRWKYLQKEADRHFNQPLWLNDQPVHGRTLLIHAEQGYGDMVQFCRYAPMAEALGARVVIEAFPPLLPLLSTLKGNFTLVPRGEPLPAFDLYCPVMSLPLAFKTTVATIPAGIPYLFADPARLSGWQQKLGPRTRLRIGLAWSGRPTHPNDHNRSIPLNLLAPLLQLPAEFHVLQQEITAADAATLAGYPQVKMHSGELKDFADTAALMQEMDLVISVDTSVAHVAGALGRPLWVLLPYAPDFRWLLDRTDSPWYPGATLFRQSAPGAWAPVIAEVAGRVRAEKDSVREEQLGQAG